MKRATATHGSWLYCSKKSHCSISARCHASRRQQRRAFGEIAQDRVRLGEAAAIVELEQRHLAVRILRKIFRRARLRRARCRSRSSDTAARAARAAAAPCSSCPRSSCRRRSSSCAGLRASREPFLARLTPDIDRHVLERRRQSPGRADCASRACAPPPATRRFRPDRSGSLRSSPDVANAQSIAAVAPSIA